MREPQYGPCQWPTREPGRAPIWTDDRPMLPALLRALKQPDPPPPGRLIALWRRLIGAA